MGFRQFGRFSTYGSFMKHRTHNKTLLAQATPVGTAYCVVRPKAGRYVPKLVRHLISTILLFSCGPVHSWEYADAEAASNAMSEMKHERSAEYLSSEGEAVNSFFQLAKPCVALGEKEFIILNIDSNGAVLDAATERSGAKTKCLLILAKATIFAMPPWQPYYLKVKL